MLDLGLLEALEHDGHPLPRALVDTPEDRWVDALHRHELVRSMLSRLGARERDILELRFGLVDDEQWTLERIGDRYGVTRERIRQIERRAIDRLTGLVCPPIDEPGRAA